MATARESWMTPGGLFTGRGLRWAADENKSSEID